MSKFFKVRCKCGEERTVFSHSSTLVRCRKCKEPLAHPAGGEAVIHAEIEKEMD